MDYLTKTSVLHGGPSTKDVEKKPESVADKTKQLFQKRMSNG